MIKRPVCIAALFLLAVLVMGKYLGQGGGPARDTSSPGEEIISKRVLAAGTVQSREPTASGERLYLNHFIISFKNSKQQSFTNSDFEKLKNLYGDSGAWQMIVYLEDTDKNEMSLQVGSRVLLEGELKVPDSAGNPGQFDAWSYYLPRKVLYLLQDTRVEKKLEEGRNFTGFLAGIRERLQSSYEQVLGQTQAGVISAITLGDRSGLPQEIKEIYQEGGIAHVLAISSLHITLLGRGLYRLLRKLRLSFFSSGLLSAALILSFCMMTGMSVSAQRACLMYGLWLGSQIFGRTNDGLTSLSAAALAVLLLSPEYLWDGSFLLSFGCVLSLQFLSPVLERLLPIPGKLGASLRSSAAVTLGTLPVVMYSFYQITPYAVLVNLLVIPCMSLVMVSGLAGSVLGCVWVPLGTIAASPCHYLLELFEALCRFERKLPGAVVITGRPGMGQMILYYLFLFLLWLSVRRGFPGVFLFWREGGGQSRALENRRREGGRTKAPENGARETEEKKRARAGQKRAGERKNGVMSAGARVWGGLFLTAGLATLLWRPLPRLQITCLDVGQGDSILVRSGSFSCLIDGGSSSVKGVWQYRIEGALKYYGVSRLNAVFLSHGDSDHVNGVEEMLNSYETDFLGERAVGITVDQIILPDTGYEDEHLDDIAGLATERHIPVGRMGEGDRIVSGNLSLTCLHPGTDILTGDSNQDSMVLLLECLGVKGLFTGDLEGEGEERLLEKIRQESRPGSCEGLAFLKVGHHGSKNGTSRALLDCLSPRIGLISCGKNNRYGHPAQEVLERLEEGNVQVYRTDVEGAVTLNLGGNGLEIRPYRAGETE